MYGRGSGPGFDPLGAEADGNASVSPRAILIVRPFNRFDSARCAVKR